MLRIRHRTVAVFAVLALAACSGKDGAPGRDGVNGTNGVNGADGTKGDKGDPGVAPRATTEACFGCHDASLASKHQLNDQLGVVVRAQHWSATGAPVLVTGVQLPAVTIEQNGNATIRFHVDVNGAPRNDFVLKAQDARAHNEDAYWVYDATAKAGVRPKIATGNLSVVANGNGNYTATVLAAALTTPPVVEGTMFMLSFMSGATFSTATVEVVYGNRTHDSVSNKACINCHGQLVWKDAVHDVTFVQGVDGCIVCHNRVFTDGTDKLMGMIHGIHNSANMPGGEYVFTWGSNGNKFPFKKGFPGNMNNCRTCHDSDARVAGVNAQPISYALCMSCHKSWDGFAKTKVGGGADFHRAYTASSSVNCAVACHNVDTVQKLYKASQAHDGQVTERAGLIWDGADQSVVLAPTIKLAITGVKVNGTNLEVSWTAKNASGTAYDPCNSDFAAGPVFFGYAPGTGTEGCTNTVKGCDSSFSVLRAYAQANDWVNDALKGSSSPGQPAGSTTLKATNTTCDASKVATTVVPLDTTTATRGIVAIQGKPQVKFGASGTIIWVRSQTPTREFVVTTGALPTVQRRTVVDVNKCNACHLGTLYQHGGTRVDSIELCVMCHNPAANEQNRRSDIGITAANAHDGKNGESYDLRVMVHAIHAAGAERGPSPGYDANKVQIPGPLLDAGQPLMYYRTNGVFFFGSKEALPANWPPIATPDACVTCGNEDGTLVYCPVVGSKTSGNKYERNSDGTCKNDVASTSGTWRPYRLIEVHYPRPLNDCSACHANGWSPQLPDPTKAVAVSFEAGAAPWNNLLDDKLIGPTTASCMSCHGSGDAVKQFSLRKHAYDYSWLPSVFEFGRQDLIDAIQ